MFEPNRDDTEYILSCSYGKDSLACLGACEQLGWRIDRIVHAEVWATDTIPADLPPMVEFKNKADEIIKARWGIEVEHYSVSNYQNQFYTLRNVKRLNQKKIYGFPIVKGAWCNSKLKIQAINKANNKQAKYIVGIASDEPKRIEKARKRGELLPLVDIGWTEADAKQWCIDNDLLSPIYTSATRGGCWFCHNQGINQLRLLRKNYPELWALLMKWDLDSPVSFRADGHTVHDFDRRFQAEDEGFFDPMVYKNFRWEDVDIQQYNIFQFLESEE